MTLRDAIEQYIEWRQAHGASCRGVAAKLTAFLNSIDGGINCDAITNEQVLAFLAGNGPLTQTRAIKYSALSGFYRYAISRGYVSRSPLPDYEPKRPAPALPYVYSHDEVHRIFNAIDASLIGAVTLDAYTFRTLLQLLYGAGLRLGEALRLTIADVELSDAILSVRDSKFYKSRIVPAGPQLADALTRYALRRLERPTPHGRGSAFLANPDGAQLGARTVQKWFSRLLRVAAISSVNCTRRSPCLHSLRHSFAVHRLTAWYRQRADVQRLLPILSTYLGHADLAGTQVYLSMTPELLQQASLRFERYARGGNDA